MTADASPDVDALRRALTTSVRFAYRNAFALVGVSVAWSIGALPLVTVGPATLGAYAAIASLAESGSIDYGRVRTRVRQRFVHAMLLGWLPGLFGFVSVAYFGQYATTRSWFAGGLSVVSAYAAAYAVLVLIPAFVEMSRGRAPVESLKVGRRWVTGHPTLAVTTGLVTLGLFVGTALLTVGFVLLFPATAFTFHTRLLAEDGEPVAVATAGNLST